MTPGIRESITAGVVGDIEPTEVARRKELHAYMRARGVTAVGHFTRLRNLGNILKHGLQPRGRLEEMGVAYAANDGLRIDGGDGVCLSVSFPNYKLFYKFRNEFPGEQWVVLVLSTEVIERKACIFNPKNAASSAMTGYSKERRMRMDALQAMFYDQEIEAAQDPVEERTTLRAKLRLPDHFTTDPQAEIVVTESIEPTLISAMIFGCDDTHQNREILRDFFRNNGSNWGGTVSLKGEDAFIPRFDYRHWRNDDG